MNQDNKVIIPVTFLGNVHFKGRNGEDVALSQFIYFNSLDIFYSTPIDDKIGTEFNATCVVRGTKLKIDSIKKI